MPIKSTLVSSQIKPCEAHVPSQDEWLVIQLQLHWMTLRSEWRCRMNKQMRPHLADRRTAAFHPHLQPSPAGSASCIRLGLQMKDQMNVRKHNQRGAWTPMHWRLRVENAEPNHQSRKGSSACLRARRVSDKARPLGWRAVLGSDLVGFQLAFGSRARLGSDPVGFHQAFWV